MYFYLKGKIISVFSNKIVIEVNNIGYEVVVSRPQAYLIETNNIGYEVLVARPNSFLPNEERLVYLYQHIHDDKTFLVGFDNIEEKNIFMLLIEVNGLGPRTALSMLQNAYPDEIYNAIISNNVAFLKKIPGVGSKCASQIILDLHGKLAGKKGNPKQYDEVYLTLKELGFKKAMIDNVLSSINEPNATNEEILKIALRKLRP